MHTHTFFIKVDVLTYEQKQSRTLEIPSSSSLIPIFQPPLPTPKPTQKLSRKPLFFVAKFHGIFLNLDFLWNQVMLLCSEAMNTSQACPID